MPTSTQQLADILHQAHLQKQSCAPIRTQLATQDVETAYAIQKINIERAIAQGQHMVGKKIGLTSKKVQQQLGVDQPDFGVLLNNMQVENSQTIPWNALMQPKAEAEIAFVLKADLTAEHINMSMVKNAIDYATAAIEIVGSRIADWDISIVDTIADNASSSHFVLNHEKIDYTQIDLENCKMKLWQNGTVASEGQGSACLGNPLIAVLWLAQTMQQLGNPLQKGDIILSGALGPMVALQAGDEISAEISGVGEVSFSVGEEKQA